MSEVVQAAARFTDAVARCDDTVVREVVTSPVAAAVAVYLAEMLNDTAAPVVLCDTVAVQQLAVARHANVVLSARVRQLEGALGEHREIAADRARRSTASRSKAA